MSLFGLSCIPVSREQCNIVRCTYLGRHNVCDVTGRRSNADRSCCSVRAVASRRRYSHEWRVCYTGVYRVCVLLVCIAVLQCICTSYCEIGLSEKVHHGITIPNYQY